MKLYIFDKGGLCGSMVQIRLVTRTTNEDDFTHNMVLQMKHTHHTDQYKVLGRITNQAHSKTANVLEIDWYREPQLDENDVLEIHTNKLFKNNTQRMMEKHDIIYDNERILTKADSMDNPGHIINSYLKNETVINLVSTKYYEKHQQYVSAAQALKHLMVQHPAYKQIMIKGEKLETHDLVSLLTYIPKEKLDDILVLLQYGNNLTYKTAAEKILKDSEIETETFNLMTQEHQIETFINFSKENTRQKDEKVTDETIDNLKQSNAYQRIKTELTTKGYGLSETQQFNVLQTVGLFTKNNDRIIYNLSDMGSGKTLMTIESIYMMDLMAIERFEEQENHSTILEQAKRVEVMDKHLVTPKLSVTSSWVKTFELFYDVKKITDEQYQLTIESNGIKYQSTLYIAPFTVTNNVKIDKTLPVNETEAYLIVDEIHQLVQKPLSHTKVFNKDTNMFKYLCFVLSGTLSNLTTTQWYHYHQFMKLPYVVDKMDTLSPRDLKSSADTMVKEYKEQLAESSKNLVTEQKRTIDDNVFEEEQTTITKHKLTGKQEYYHNRYSSLVLDINENLETRLNTSNYKLKIDPNIIDTPNFELFYTLVGANAITAQSTTIAEELFGEQKTQHQATVINASSNLNETDLELLKVIHQIATDHHQYKSKSLATKISNAILNLNDGLQEDDLYGILSKAASSNNRFLSYLTTLDLKVLERLPESSLISSPSVETTEKYKIVKELLESESDETYLIVVNDYTATQRLSKALGIKSLTKNDLKNPLEYQTILDNLFEQQNTVVVPQAMIKSSLDLVQANRLIQYQLNSEISDIIQTQNRINRIGQTRETKAFYIATDQLQENIIELFLDTYKNIRVAHKGIVELFVDITKQVNVINDYIGKALNNIKSEPTEDSKDIALFDVKPYEQPYEPVLEEIEKDDKFHSQTDTLFHPTEFAKHHQLIPV